MNPYCLDVFDADTSEGRAAPEAGRASTNRIPPAPAQKLEDEPDPEKPPPPL